MQIYDQFIAPILQNQIATGLSVTALFGMLAYQVRQLPNYFKELLERVFIVRLQVKSTDTAFIWLERWLAKQPYSKRAKSVVLKSYGSDNSPACGLSSSTQESSWDFSPGNGSHMFWWRRRLIWLDRSNDRPGDASGNSRGVLEIITLATIGRSQAALRAIVSEAEQVTLKENTIGIKLWRGWWATVKGKKARALETIILDNGLKESILQDVAWFYDNRDWYAKRGVPWRRGYLFSGPPGTGKTSFVLALAAYFNKTICVLNLGSVEDDKDLFSAVMDAPPNAIIVIEDIDCAMSTNSRQLVKGPAEAGDNAESEGITKAGLLNALDGITTPDGRILIMTTNHPEMLDPALVRPGRADVSHEFGYLGAEAQERLAELYYDKGSFVTLPYAVAPASMQKAFMHFPDDSFQARQLLVTMTTRVKEG